MTGEQQKVERLIERGKTVKPRRRAANGAANSGEPLLKSVRMSGLAIATPAATRWVIDRVLPRRPVTLLAGHGNTGKSYLALTLAAHVACGASWAELPCVGGKALYLSLEDEGDLVRLRLRRVAEAYNLDLDAIERGVTVLDGSDTESALAMEIASKGIRALAMTSAYNELTAAAAEHALTIIDNASDAYDAPEGERRMVRRFIRALQRDLGREHDAAVLLLAHIDKAGARYGTAGESYSGSTAWHNSVRSRLALIETESGLELRHEKSNFGPELEHAIALERNEHGVPIPLSRQARVQRADGDATAVAQAIRAAIDAGVTVPTARQGPRTAALVLATRPELPEELANDRRRLWDAITKLERDGRLRRESYRTADRKDRERFSC